MFKRPKSLQMTRFRHHMGMKTSVYKISVHEPSWRSPDQRGEINLLTWRSFANEHKFKETSVISRLPAGNLLEVTLVAPNEADAIRLTVRFVRLWLTQFVRLKIALVRCAWYSSIHQAHVGIEHMSTIVSAGSIPTPAEERTFLLYTMYISHVYHTCVIHFVDSTGFGTWSFDFNRSDNFKATEFMSHSVFGPYCQTN